MKSYRGFGGWRWWSKRDWFYLSIATDINWFHVYVGPVELRVARRCK